MEPRESHHPVFDLGHWRQMFSRDAIEAERRARFPERPELWRASGQVISSPRDLCEVEAAREVVAQSSPLGRAVPSHVFLWAEGEPERPYLTKLGGVPHRERSAPWPENNYVPYSFVAQICFADSKGIVSDQLPGDVLLMFFEEPDAAGDVHLEWSSLELSDPTQAEDCPRPGFVMPRFSGVLHRGFEFPDSEDLFYADGRDESYLLPVTQSTKIGRETYFIQQDPRCDGEEFLCALSSIQLNSAWPLTNLERLPDDLERDPKEYGWGRYEMMFADVGCFYVLIDAAGNVRWDFDCY